MGAVQVCRGGVSVDQVARDVDMRTGIAIIAQAKRNIAALQVTAGCSADDIYTMRACLYRPQMAGRQFFGWWWHWH